MFDLRGKVAYLKMLNADQAAKFNNMMPED